MRKVGAGRESYEEKYPDFQSAFWKAISRKTSADPRRRSIIGRYHGGLRTLGHDMRQSGFVVTDTPLYRRFVPKRVCFLCLRF